MKKGILSFLLAIGICFSFVSCVQSLDPEVNTENTGNGNTGPTPPENPQLQEGLYLYQNEMNPSYDSRTQALDSIFNPDVLGEMVLVIDRSEWNKHLEYCDVDIEHEESVVAKGFYFTKDSKQWFFKDIGFRIRGNTSRRKPQDSAGNYVQSHFALDFEEWLTDEDKAANLDKKLAKSMRGVMLKRFKDDATYSREVYGYNLFRKNGIWIAPRAAYTTLKIQIVDDLDLDKDGDTKEFETVNYGVYGMIEEIKKRFLAERTEKQGGGKFVGNNGNLWKCTWKGCRPNFVESEATSIGEESIEPVYENGEVVQFNKETFTYDYKGDNTLEEGKTQLLAFMEELNKLPNCNDGNNDEADIATIKEFYTNKMDGDLFLRTYAINVILGMNDDYWVNNNNFYFYFDEDGKGYFIPYDYDNILGVSCVGGFDVGTKNPMEWGSLTDGQHPLIQKILNVPEYMDLYKSYLDLYSNEQSYFDDDKSIAQITKWQSMIQNYIYSSDLAYKDTTSTFEDKVAGWSQTYVDYKIYTPSSMNYFTVRQKAIKAYLNPSSEKLTLTINAGDGTFESGKKTMTCDFEMLETIQEVISRNNVGIKFTDNGSIEYAYEKGGYYYRPVHFVDEKGNKVSESTTLFESMVLNVAYAKYIPVQFDFNGGTYDSASTVTTYILENDIISDYEVVTPTKDGYVFVGWTATQDGTDYVDIIGNKEITLYAKWVSQNEVKPLYEYSQDNTEVTFIFRPADFGYNWPDGATYTVRLMSAPSGWEYNEDYNFTKATDGNYTLIVKYNDVKDDFGGWAGFKFYVEETDDWLGPNKYNAVILPEQICGDESDPAFRFELLQPKLTLDLNGGNIDGNTDSITFETNEIQGCDISWILESYGYSNPTNGDLIFAGWTYTKDGQDFTTYIPYGVVTLYARWVEAVECTLTVNAGEYGYFRIWDEEIADYDQKSTIELTFTAGDMLQNVPGFEYPYTNSDENGMYQFLYFVDESGNEIYWDTTLTGSATITAVYEYKPLITITLNPNGGSYWSDELQEEITYTAQYSQCEGYGLPWPEKDGCVFDGWYDTVSNERVYECSSEYTSLIAYWIDVFSNADIIGNMTYNAGEALTKEDDVTYSYTFTYSSDMAGPWETSANQIAFKLRPNSEWDGTQMGSYYEIYLDKDEEYCYKDAGNIVCSNLVEGSTYKITFRLEDNNLRVGVSTVE